MNKLTIVKKLYLGFGLIVAVMLGLAVLAGVNLGRLNASSEQRLHSLRLVAQGNAAYADLAQAAASLRNYGFTGDQKMLDNYQHSIDNLIKESLPKVQAEAAADSAQAVRMQKLEGMVKAWISDFASPFITKRAEINAQTAELAALSALSISLGDKAKISPMATLIKELTAEANELNRVSKQQNESIRQQTILYLWLGTAVGAVIAFVVSVCGNCSGEIWESPLAWSTSRRTAPSLTIRK